MQLRSAALIAVAAAILLAACGSTALRTTNSAAPRAHDPQLYDPTDAGELLPDGYRQVIRRDAIAPVYNPTFVAARSAMWSDDALILGVELDGEARAYPIGFLNRREMVIDNHRGIPTLVTW